VIFEVVLLTKVALYEQHGGLSDGGRGRG